VDVAVTVQERSHASPKLRGPAEGRARVIGADRGVVGPVGREVADDGLDIVGVPGVEEGTQSVRAEHGRQSIGSTLADFAGRAYLDRTMKTRLSLLLGLLLAVTPASVAAQAESPLPEAIDPELVTELCAATADDEDELTTCIDSVEVALTEMSVEVVEEEQSLLDQLADTVDDTLEDLREVDLQATFDDALASAQEFDVDAALAEAQEAVDQAVADAQTAIDELELPTDVDIQVALEEAAAEALTAVEQIDFEAAVDDALAEARTAIEEADLDGAVDDAVVALETAVTDAQATVGAAQAWATENREAVCRGSSVSLGTTVGIAVFVVTGVEWLGLQAFLAAERFTNAFCGDLVGE